MYNFGSIDENFTLNVIEPFASFIFDYYFYFCVVFYFVQFTIHSAILFLFSNISRTKYGVIRYVGNSNKIAHLFLQSNRNMKFPVCIVIILHTYIAI